MPNEPGCTFEPDGHGYDWQNRAVLVSSYLMSELGDVADHLVVVSRGRVTADTSIREHCACG